MAFDVKTLTTIVFDDAVPLSNTDPAAIETIKTELQNWVDTGNLETVAGNAIVVENDSNAYIVRSWTDTVSANTYCEASSGNIPYTILKTIVSDAEITELENRQ